MTGRLEGRAAIVTGSGHGIGRAYALRLAAEGADVVIAEIDGDAGERVAEEIRRSVPGRRALAVRADVADEASVGRMVETALASFGRIDVLLNNAGVFTTDPIGSTRFDELGVGEFERVLRINVIGTWLCCRGVVGAMRAAGYGKIINVSSSIVFKGNGADMLHYVTSKSALLGMTRTLARELGPDGIRVNTLAPGFTITSDDDRPLSSSSASRALRREETPDDLVGTAAFLAGPDSDFITGQTIVVDGGAHML